MPHWSIVKWAVQILDEAGMFDKLPPGVGKKYVSIAAEIENNSDEEIWFLVIRDPNK